MTKPIPMGSAKAERAIRFGRELERAMKARGVGGHTIALAGVGSRNSVRAWRYGRNLPRIETIRKLALALDWPRLAELGTELRTKTCPIDGVRFIDDSGSDNRVYCTPRCQDVATKLTAGTSTTVRAAMAERRLRLHREAVAAFCTACEPEGRCVTPACELRPVSPLPLFEERLSVATVEPRPHNGYRDTESDAARQRRVWASYSPEERQARVDRAAERRREQLARTAS